jgi:hypothetical protein
VALEEEAVEVAEVAEAVEAVEMSGVQIAMFQVEYVSFCMYMTHYLL